ncbi:MAG: SCP2 sterol-binding domain-containing protein [Sulfuricellaceae bacterium]|nr:SCP2 sterol-binding domain-containing protein [Sulfuricellaceae bacterium]
MKPFFFPKPFSTAMSLLPQYPHALIFSQVVNLALKKKLLDEVWQPLHGKQVCICVKDAGVALHFTLNPAGLVARRASAQPDLTITASAQDFLLLALRKEDPDTLFFCRRLVMEGDTELGLLVKNTLDGMEMPELSLNRLLPGQILDRIRTRLLT